MSDWIELTETHGMSAGDPDECVECGDICPHWDNGFEFDRGHDEFYVILNIAPEDYDERRHPTEIFVPLHGNCYESATGNHKMNFALLKRIRAWYYGE